VSDDPQHVCGICGKFVRPEDCVPDALGIAVHKECNGQLPLKYPLTRAATNKS
jgi:hypothetical protein